MKSTYTTIMTPTKGGCKQIEKRRRDSRAATISVLSSGELVLSDSYSYDIQPTAEAFTVANGGPILAV